MTLFIVFLFGFVFVVLFSYILSKVHRKPLFFFFLGFSSWKEGVRRVTKRETKLTLELRGVDRTVYRSSDLRWYTNCRISFKVNVPPSNLLEKRHKLPSFPFFSRIHTKHADEYVLKINFCFWDLQTFINSRVYYIFSYFSLRIC